MDTAQKLEKAFGCLIGLAIGDSIGDQARSPENHALFGITRDMVADVSWSTDDTEFALLVAKELIDARGDLTTPAVVEAWLEHVVSQNDLGVKGGESEKGAAWNLKNGLRPPLSGVDNSYNDSDGAAMRVAPVGIVCAGDPQRAARLAAVDACISHAGDGITGAQAVAASVAVAMTGGSVDEIISAGRQFIPDDSWLGRRFDLAMHIIQEAQFKTWEAWDALHLRLRAGYRAANAEALPEAYAIFKLTGGDFVEGVLLAANFGRDADTLAALVGAWAGARHGARAIPEKWIEKARFPSGRCLKFTAGMDIREISSHLAALIRLP